MFLKIQWRHWCDSLTTKGSVLVLCMYHHAKSVLCYFFLQKREDSLPAAGAVEDL